MVVLRDVTELRRLEGVRRDFVANVSHELRTPLTSIRALVETLEAGALHDPEVSTDFLARIVSEVDRLAQLVDELLDLARLESGRIHLALEPVAPESLIDRAVQRMAPQTARAGLTVEYRGGAWNANDHGRPRADRSGAAQPGSQCGQVHPERGQDYAPRVRRRWSRRISGSGHWDRSQPG